MKKLFVLLILLLFFGRSQATDIEARTGILEEMDGDFKPGRI